MQRDRRDLVLKVILVMAILSMAGPEVVPALEMTTLLELLGATLFLTAFGAGVRLVARDFLRSFADLLLPPALVAIYRQTTRPVEKGKIAGYLLFHAVHWLMLFVVCIAFVASHVR